MLYSSEPWDKGSIDAEVARLVDGVAARADVEPEGLRWDGSLGLGGFRSLAAALTLQVVGRSLDDLAVVFGIKPRTMRQTAYCLRHYLSEAHFREQVLEICMMDLQRAVPGTPGQAKWATKTALAIWEASGNFAGLSGEQLIANTEPKLVSVRYLAVDVCLRLPSMTQLLLSEHVIRLSNEVHQKRRNELPLILREDADLRWLDRELGALFHVPIRKESAVE